MEGKLESKEHIDPAYLKEHLSTEGLAVCDKILSNPDVLKMIETEWHSGSSNKLDWREIQSYAEKQKPTTQEKADDLTPIDKRSGYYSVIFLTKPDGKKEPYVIGKEIKKGGKAVLKNAYNLLTGQHVALKIVRNVTASTEEMQREREGLHYVKRLIAEQKRPEKSKEYLAQDFIRGMDMRDYIKGFELLKPTDFNLSDIKNINHIIFHTLQSVNSLHADHYVHRDLKLENIMITPSLESSDAKIVKDILLIDFGSMDKNPGKLVDIGLGTVEYRAPEIKNPPEDVPVGQARFTQETDAYAIGVTFKKLIEPLESQQFKVFAIKKLGGEKKTFNEMLKELKTVADGLTESDPTKRLTISAAFEKVQEIFSKPENSALIAENTKESLNELKTASLSR